MMAQNSLPVEKMTEVSVGTVNESAQASAVPDGGPIAKNDNSDNVSITSQEGRAWVNPNTVYRNLPPWRHDEVSPADHFAVRESSNFLRKMLNSARKSDSRAHATLGDTAATSATIKRSPLKQTHLGGKAATGQEHHVLSDMQNRMPTLKSSPSKAAISIVSSDIQATAHQSHTAGDTMARASSRLGRLSGIEPKSPDTSATKLSSAMKASTSPVKAIPERVSSAAGRRPIGYDGSGDAPDATEPEASKPNDPADAKESFDTMGVTKEDFDTRRPDPKSAQHYAAVNDFFRDLRKREFKAMNATKHKNASGRSTDRADKGT